VGLDANDPAAEDDLLLLSEFFLPVDRPVSIRLRSKDVLHGFYLPHFRVKQDAVPGMNIDIWFVPTVEGTFELACAELCGFGHYKMRGILHVVSEEEFEQFLQEEPPFLY
jgi:cytochrome c oxidase subunit 2